MAMPPAVRRELDALRRARTADQVEARIGALDAVGAPAAEVRAALLEAYERLAEVGPKRDTGCLVRVALLRALRSRVTWEDVPLLVTAIDTYENAPPGPVEVAAMLRATALLGLSEIDPGLAAYHACAHLDDVDPMSSEPGLTAVRLLGAQDHLPALYAFSCGRTEGEVLAECLRQLAAAPPSIVDRLIGAHRTSEDQAVLAAVVDLLVEHREPEWAEPVLLGLLAGAPVAVFRYGAALLVARRRVELVERLGQRPEVTGEPRRAAVFAEAAALLPR